MACNAVRQQGSHRTECRPAAGANDSFCASTELARRICELAKPGQVVVSEVVCQLVAGKGFAFEPLGARLLDGFDEAVTLHKLGVG